MAQHYVSRFYIKNFACDSDKSLVFSMSRDYTIHDKPSQISNICSKKNYNTHEQEQEQCRLEGKYAKILREFVQTPNPETFYGTRDFVEFVGFMWGNNISVRKSIAKVFSEVSLRELRQMLGGGDVSSHVEYRKQLESSIAFADCIFEELLNWKFVRLNTRGDHKVFITSDNPVSIFNPNVLSPVEIRVEFENVRIKLDDENIPISEGKVSRKTQLNLTFEKVFLGQDVILFFPVTPSVRLLGFSNMTTHLKYMNRDPSVNNHLLAFMNILTFNQCNRTVYSHSKKMLENTKINMPHFLQHCQHLAENYLH